MAEHVYPVRGFWLYLETTQEIGGFPPGAYRVKGKKAWGPESWAPFAAHDAMGRPEDYTWEPWRPSLYDLVGRKVYARTVTYARVGLVVHADDVHLYLHPCADVLESGAFTSFFGGKPKTYAVIPTSLQWPATVQIGACVTIDPYSGEIPTKGGE
jgi:hypothetical protein